MTITTDTMFLFEKERLLFGENGFSDFSDFMNFRGGTVISRKRGRTVVRLELQGRAFYLKRNTLHWGECLKTLSRFRLPPRNAVQEWENISSVENIGVPTVSRIAVGERLFLGREIASFILTEELYGAKPLEEVSRRDFTGRLSTPMLQKKRHLITKVAVIARKLHERGMYHQDFYLGHFFLGRDGTLYLIDQQRVIQRRKGSHRHVVKDLAQLNYSADSTGGISKSDRLRFFLEYLQCRKPGPSERSLMRQIMAKTDRIAKHTVKLLERRRRRKEIP